MAGKNSGVAMSGRRFGQGVGVIAAAAVSLIAGCSSGTTASPSTVTVTDSGTPTTQPPAWSSTAAVPSPSAAAPSVPPDSAGGSNQTWSMPNLIGQDLQSAQDAIQSMTNDGVWYSDSNDLTGKGREQVMDRNWQVCTSTPPPGATITSNTSITFGVVRIDSESCP